MTPVSPFCSRPVLVVEDDPTLRELLASILEAEGYATRTAAHGGAALNLIRSDPRPSMVLLDLMMPVMDGWEFRERQLSDPEIREIPVAIHTACIPDARELQRLQPVAILEKPMNVADLLRVVREIAAPGQ